MMNHFSSCFIVFLVCLSFIAGYQYGGIFGFLANDQFNNLNLLSPPSNDIFDDNETVEKCGVYYFYHVGKTGGTSVKSWQEGIANEIPEIITFRLWANAQNKFPENHWKEMYDEIDQTVKSGMLAKGRKWLSLHHHHGTPGLRYMMPKLRVWKSILESQGCDLIMTTVLREPLSRAKSLVSYNQIPIEKFPFFVENYEGQGTYLLYNSCEHIPRDDILATPQWCESSPSKVAGHDLSEEDIQEVLGYLSEFDIVKKTEELDDFVTESEALTEWNLGSSESEQAPKKNPSIQSYDWTEEMYDMMNAVLKDDQILWERQFG